MRDTKEIFGDALELSGVERLAFLDQACANDAALRQRLLSLLSAAERDDVFLSAAVMDGGKVPLGPTLEEDVGSSIGPYELIELLGEGGFGSVFKAQQTHPVRRTVALKVIKMGMDTRSVVARFEQERQSLAIMDHPHIAKVLDAGSTRSGRPYFVMDMVEGSAITAYSDEHSLSIPQRLNLFIQVCQAVQYAHIKGVIHRDLKPSNVLVTSSDEGPFARVIDFGIAKAVQPPADNSKSLTEHWQFVGTPHYMSPEQACGSIDIDTRSDVYSLGVLLYELVAGSTPFDPATLRSAGLVEMQRILTNDEPPAPSTRVARSSTLSTLAASRSVEPARLSTLLRDELDWVVMRALEIDRSHRYTSPAELAADLLRHMNGEAVVAVPPSRSYRLRKLIARHRGAALSASAVVAAVVVGLGTALWQASIANREREEANQRRLETEQIASFQDEQLRGMDPATMGNVIRDDLIEEFRGAMHQSPLAPGEREAREQEFVSLLNEANFTDIALRTLETSFFDRTISAIHERFADQPLVQAQLFMSTSETMRNLGMLKASYEPLSRALETRRTILGQDHPLTIASLVSLGRLHWMSGNLDEAESALSDANQRAQRTLGQDSPIALDALNALGFLHQTRSRFDKCEAMFRDILERRQRVLGPDHADSIRSLATLARLLAIRGRSAESDAMHIDALDRSIRVCGPDHPDTLALKSTYSILLRQQKRSAESESLLRSVLQARQRIRGESHPETLATLNQLGMTLKGQGRLPEAEELYREALSGYRRVLGSTHGQTLDTMNNLAALLALTQRPAEAEALYREALAGNERISGATSLPSSIIRHDLAQFLQRERRFAEAESLYIQAQATMEHSAAATDTHRRAILSRLADLYESWNAAEPGQGHDRKALETRAKFPATDHNPH